MPRTCLAMLALALTTLAIVGCGKSASSTTTTQATTTAASAPTTASTPQPTRSTSVAQTGPLTRTALIAQANAICSRISAKRKLLTFKGSTQLELILPTLTAYEQALFTELHSLTPPASMASSWNQMVADAHALAESTAKLNHYAHEPNAQSNSPAVAQPLLTAFAQNRLKLDRIAGHNGITVCATY